MDIEEKSAMAKFKLNSDPEPTKVSGSGSATLISRTTIYYSEFLSLETPMSISRRRKVVSPLFLRNKLGRKFLLFV